MDEPRHDWRHLRQDEERDMYGEMASRTREIRKVDVYYCGTCETPHTKRVVYARWTKDTERWEYVA
jgi:hypothetical protein